MAVEEEGAAPAAAADGSATPPAVEVGAVGHAAATTTTIDGRNGTGGAAAAPSGKQRLRICVLHASLEGSTGAFVEVDPYCKVRGGWWQLVGSGGRGGGG